MLLFYHLLSLCLCFVGFFCLHGNHPRISPAEIHQEGGISAVGGTGSIYTFYGPDEPKFKNLTENFLKKVVVTPLKINMEHNHGGLEDHFPF